jgi:hypothetical protein
MKLLSQHGIIFGFRAAEINELVPELVDCGETRHRSPSQGAPHLHGHWELYYQVSGVTHHYSMGGRSRTGIFLECAPQVILAT